MDVSDSVYLDTGPWVAYLSARDRHHAWARETLDALSPPLLTCEAVVSETCFLLGRHRAAALKLLETGAVRLGFEFPWRLPMPVSSEWSS